MSNASSKKKPMPVATERPAISAPPDQYKAANWKPWWGLLAIAGSFLGAQVVAVVIVTALPNLLQMTHSEATAWLDSTFGRFLFVALAEVVALVFVWLFLRERKAANKDAIGLNRPWKPSDISYAVLAAAAYFVLFAIVVAIITNVFDQNFDQRQETGFNTVVSRPGLLLTFVGLVVLPPVVEEILFRGVFFGGLRRRFSFVWATIITSAVFAIPHLAESKDGGVLWLAGVDTLILSFFLCYLREKTGSLWASIFLHMTKNGIAFLYLFVLVQR